ncbi:unnamed protein product [Angiostrongylus costaricensis]|uniref:RNA_GG_bind domain-containing protein n=1 Tax=Angiostrongylus costaricensis TaxID=334426 RepID=A0A0R3Q017_ANGCS|nr:unnamed protein product [Angiostrongylus costaricensis]
MLKVADRSHLISPLYSLEKLMAVQFATDISTEQLGDEIAEALGERNLKLIRSVVLACGSGKALSLFEKTREVERGGGMMMLLQKKVLVESNQEARRVMRARKSGRFNFSKNEAKPDKLMKKEGEKDSALDTPMPLPPIEHLFRQHMLFDAGKPVSNDGKFEDTLMET